MGLVYFFIVFCVFIVSGFRCMGEDAENKRRGIAEDEQRIREGKVPYGTYLDRKCRTRLIENDQLVFYWRDKMHQYPGEKGDLWILTDHYKPLRNISAEERALAAKKG